MSNPAFAKKVYSLQNGIVRELNNSHIFLEQAQPVLVTARAKYEESKSKSDKRYYVPSVGRVKFAKRTDAELKAIYNRYITTGLFEAFLVNSLSRFESFLADVLSCFLTYYPLRILERVQGVPACQDIPVKDLIASPDKGQLLDRVCREHLTNVFRQRPSLYMTYLSAVVGVKVDPSFLDYYEIAATRDLIVHNSSVVNQLYLDKAKEKARGKIGEMLVVDQAYYYDALAKMKKVSGAIKRDVENKYA
jgi:hypothetical protein